MVRSGKTSIPLVVTTTIFCKGVVVGIYHPTNLCFFFLYVYGVLVIFIVLIMVLDRELVGFLFFLQIMSS